MPATVRQALDCHVPRGREDCCQPGGPYPESLWEAGETDLLDQKEEKEGKSRLADVTGHSEMTAQLTALSKSSLTSFSAV